MRAVQIAFFVICLQIGLGIVVVSGVFPGNYYESSITNYNIRTNISASSEDEQIQGSIDVYNAVVDSLTWGWIKNFFQPWYSSSASVRAFIDEIIIFFNIISLFLIGVALFEFLRDRVNVLGGG